MAAGNTEHSPPPARQTPAERLKFNIRQICFRIARGRAAAKRWYVVLNRALRILSILLSSLGSVGIIADKAAPNLPGQTGWAFWGSIILLGFGIASQVANEFQVAQRALDARAMAEKCDVYAMRLENVLQDDDPRTGVASMLVELNTLFENERYNKVLPHEDMPPQMQDDVLRRAAVLISDNEAHWQLPLRMQQGVTPPR